MLQISTPTIITRACRIIFVLQRQTFDGLTPTIHHFLFSPSASYIILELDDQTSRSKFQNAYTSSALQYSSLLLRTDINFFKVLRPLLTTCGIFTLTIFRLCKLFTEISHNKGKPILHSHALEGVTSSQFQLGRAIVPLAEEYVEIHVNAFYKHSAVEE